MKRKCEWCGTTFKIKYKKDRKVWKVVEKIRYAHLNICQNPAIHYFCSSQCKLNWIFANLNRKNKEVIVSALKGGL